MKIAIIDYGAGNIKSIQFALNRLGYEGVLTKNPNEILSADKVIFPGVGEASSAMKKLKNSGLDELIPTLTQPVLGICLGMQLLCNHTEEGNTKGLGIFDTNVIRFSNEVKVPHMGWNDIKMADEKQFFCREATGFMYFVHSFYAEICHETIATTHYLTDFSAALQKNNFYGVQFHPEKSGLVGEKLLQNFLNLKPVTHNPQPENLIK
ncbi:imidazole glycerol phosphate synthase subunit HisH [Flavobacterium azooxidireducens]|uniref:Imidazole glycerol phosphate synthase subunit HisH n=1 Tax=Flavobacterium azooxidireducens TaxID=1871076 RepID=A0ABY4KDW8_9FLAO|nr:imidazole glycerol phosphate synthase subunit HisH [Flavobacterium azooxidireducens]UPQ78972.1 imidazole glycerol phosphate synthase subunit HisH [Flavobacterium azooxidireducens]